jgi:hypothetical protein
LQSQYHPFGQLAVFTTGVAFSINALSCDAPVWVWALAEAAARPSSSALALNMMASFRMGNLRGSNEIGVASIQQPAWAPKPAN